MACAAAVASLKPASIVPSAAKPCQHRPEVERFTYPLAGLLDHPLGILQPGLQLVQPGLDHDP